jgi:hypothetical protein
MSKTAPHLEDNLLKLRYLKRYLTWHLGYVMASLNSNRTLEPSSEGESLLQIANVVTAVKTHGIRTHCFLLTQKTKQTMSIADYEAQYFLEDCFEFICTLQAQRGASGYGDTFFSDKVYESDSVILTLCDLVNACLKPAILLSLEKQRTSSALEMQMVSSITAAQEIIDLSFIRNESLPSHVEA